MTPDTCPDRVGHLSKTDRTDNHPPLGVSVRRPVRSSVRRPRDTRYRRPNRKQIREVRAALDVMFGKPWGLR